jgi:hypothetical protein
MSEAEEATLAYNNAKAAKEDFKLMAGDGVLEANIYKHGCTVLSAAEWNTATKFTTRKGASYTI